VNPPLKFARVAGVSLIVLKFSLQLFDASKKALHVILVGNPLLRVIISMTDYDQYATNMKRTSYVERKKLNPPTTLFRAGRASDDSFSA
jgi:hypothetical protein